MYSVKCILSAALVAALTCVTAHATVTTGGGTGANPNPEYDTYVAQAASGTPDTWEITLPNNKTYYVTIACGDPSAATGPHLVKVAGDGSTYSTVTQLNVATAINTYTTATNIPVLVTASKLSLQLGGNSYANRINFIIISESEIHNSPVCASTSYSSLQDQDHWKYNYWNGSAYVPLNTLVSNEWRLNSSRPLVNINGGNPGGLSPLLNAVRTWTAPSTGTVNLSGWAVRSGVTGSGDGVTLKIIRNSEATPLLSDGIGNTDYTYHRFAVNSVAVTVGDRIQFHIDPRGPGCTSCNSNYDSTQLDAIIQYTTP